MADVSQDTVVSNGGTTPISLAVREGWVQTPQDFGARNDGSVDDGAAINAALATGQDVYMPEGIYYVESSINFTNPGQRLMGAGRLRTTIQASGAGLPQNGGYITTNSMEPGPVIEDLGFSFPQPTEGTGFNQFPTCIYLSNAPRSTIRRVRFDGAWNGLIFDGNCGGSVVEDLESGCLNLHLTADGCLDTMRITRGHFYPFSAIGSNPNQLNQFTQNSQGVNFGRVDDFKITDCLFFMKNAVTLRTGADGVGSLGSISNTDFDTFGGLVVTNSTLTVSGGSFTIGDSNSNGILVNAPEARVTVNGAIFLQGAAPNNPGQGIATAGAGGNLILNACLFNLGNFDLRGVLINGSSTLGQVSNCEFVRAPGQNYTNGGIVYGQQARPLAVGNRHNPQQAGTVTALVECTEDAPGVISCNDFGNTHLRASTSFTDIQVVANASVTRP